jgi:hypothetical protein
MKRIESWLILLGTLLIAYLLDLARAALEMMRAYRLSSAGILWLSMLLNLVFAGLMLGLAWYALGKNPGDRLTRAVYLAAGLLVMLAGTPLFFGGGVSIPAGIPYRLLAIDPGSFFILAGSFIALIGAAGLIKRYN